MTPLAQAKLVLGIVLVILMGLGLWYLYHDGYEAGKDEVQVQWDTDKIKRDETQRQALVAYANRITSAQEQHDHDQVLLTRLHDDLGRLRIHLPACPGNTAAAGQNSDGTAGVLPNRVDESFARLQERASRLFARCDQLNIDAIRANASRGLLRSWAGR